MDIFCYQPIGSYCEFFCIPRAMREAIRLILEKRRSGKRVDISKGGALIKAKATSTSRVKKHYNCGPIVLDWCERFMVKNQRHAEAIELLKQRSAMSPIPTGAPAPSQDTATHPLTPTSQEQMLSSPHPLRLPSPPPLGLQPTPPATTTPPSLPSSHHHPGPPPSMTCDWSRWLDVAISGIPINELWFIQPKDIQIKLWRDQRRLTQWEQTITLRNEYIVSFVPV